MPVVSLPDELIQQLNNSETGTINNTRGPGVAVYWSEDGTVRADIYVGLKLDGFTRYTKHEHQQGRSQRQNAVCTEADRFLRIRRYRLRSNERQSYYQGKYLLFIPVQ